MPIQFWALNGPKIVYTQWRGHVTMQDLVDDLALFERTQGYRPDWRELVDMRAVTSSDLTPAELRRYSQLLDLVTGVAAAPPIVVLAPTALTFGSIRQFEGLNQRETTPVKIQLVRTEKEALDALEITDPTLSAFLARQPEYPGDSDSDNDSTSG